MTNISTMPPMKFRSLKITTGMKGFFAVSMCTTKRYSPMPAAIASITISVEENQSLVLPRSSISCSAPSPTDRAPKPNQSNFRLLSRAVSLKNTSSRAQAAMPNGTLM